MNVRRSLRGVAVFRVSRDADVVGIDLGLAGVKFSENYSTQRYKYYFSLLDDIIAGVDIPTSGIYHRDYLCYHRRIPILCRVYFSRRSLKVEYVVLATFYPGLLAKISKMLEKAGWKRIFLLEIAVPKPSPWRGV